MSTFFASHDNAVNLIRNGGLDFVKSTKDVPPFWSLSGAVADAIPPDNKFGLVLGEDPPSVLGAARYFKFDLYSPSKVSLYQEFENRFIQMGFVAELGDPWTDFQPERIPGKYDIWETMHLRGIEVTFAFSIRVMSGKVKVSVRAKYKGLSDGVVVLDEALGSKDWIRPSHTLDLGPKKLKGLAIELERTQARASAEVHVGAIMLAVGGVEDLPYTGDPMADAIDAGTIVFAFGEVCPPGFEKMEFEEPPLFGRVYPKSGVPSEDLGGAESHDHSGARMEMNPEVGWATIEAIPPQRGETGNVPADEGQAKHTHPTSEVAAVPPTRDVILCKRL